MVPCESRDSMAMRMSGLAMDGSCCRGLSITFLHRQVTAQSRSTCRRTQTCWSKHIARMCQTKVPELMNREVINMFIESGLETAGKRLDSKQAMVESSFATQAVRESDACQTF